MIIIEYTSKEYWKIWLRLWRRFMNSPLGLKKWINFSGRWIHWRGLLGNSRQIMPALTKTVAAALDSPAIRNLNRISRVFDSQSMAAIYRTQEIVAKMDTSGIAAALRQYQTVMDTIAPTDLQIQLNERLQEWSRIMSKATYRIEPLTETRIAELTRLSSLAEEYTATDISEDPEFFLKMTKNCGRWSGRDSAFGEKLGTMFCWTD